MISSASATKGWILSDHPPNIRHTSINPGNVKICGNHICKPFENSKNSLQVIQNHSTIEKTFNKTISQITKSITNTKKE